MHILLISRHYPPEVSGGARRPYLYVRALRALGHRVTLVTPFETGDSAAIIVTNNAITRGAAQARRSPHNANASPALLNRFKAYVRNWIYWPDADIRWAKAVVKAVRCSQLKPDWIMTTSPPESIHFAGAQLSKALGVPWLAELRDCWVENPHRLLLATSKFRRVFERRIARGYLRHASAVTAVSESVMGEARNYVPLDTPELIVTHFSDASVSEYEFEPAALNLVHTGGFSLSDRRRNIGPLIAALTQAHAARPELALHIAGPLTEGERVLARNAAFPIHLHGSVSLEQSRALQAGADGLVLYTPLNSHALPGKYAEYCAAGRPILYMGGGDWLGLVNDKSALRPLIAGVIALKKQEQVVAPDWVNDKQAAQMLADFLSAMK